MLTSVRWPAAEAARLAAINLASRRTPIGFTAVELGDAIRRRGRHHPSRCALDLRRSNARGRRTAIDIRGVGDGSAGPGREFVLPIFLIL